MTDLSATARELPGTIYVDMGEWKRGEQSDILFTRSLGPCVGLTIHDPVQLIGYLAHIPPSSVIQDDILDELIPAVQAASGGTRLAGVLGGGWNVPDFPSMHATLAGLRGKLFTRLGDIGLGATNLTLATNDNPTKLVNMALDCQTGDCHIQAHDIVL